MKRIRMYSMEIEMRDIFDEICDKKAIQDVNPTETERNILRDTVFVCGRPQGSRSTQLQRYSISADSWNVMDVKVSEKAPPRVHCVNNQLYMFSSEDTSQKFR